MKSSGRIWADEVTYDKVWWKKDITFPDTYGKWNFKIVELNKEFYIFIDDKCPNLLYNGRTGAFNSFVEARNVLEEDLGSNFPSIKNKANKATRVSLVILFWIIYFALDIVMFKFIDGGLNAIGISDDNFLINGFLMLVLNVIAINRIGKLKI
jgi:hypothetical protein